GIGRAVAERALRFGMRVRACRRTDAPPPLAGIEPVGSVADLVASADHVVIAAPSTPATRHLFDASVFAAMKPGAHLVNVARGALVDQDALQAAPENERVRIWEMDLTRGARSDTHRHDADYVLVQIEGDRIAALPEPDSAGPYTAYIEADVVPGKARYIRRGGIETAINIGERRYRE